MHGLKKQIKYLSDIVRFGFSAKPVLWFYVITSFLVTFIDILSMSLLYPLSLLAQNISVPKESLYYRILGDSVMDTNYLIFLFLGLIVLRILVGTLNQSISLKAGKSLFAIISSRIFERVISKIPLEEINLKGTGFYASIAGDESFRASNTIISFSQLIHHLLTACAYYVTIAFFSMGMFVFITLFLMASFLCMIPVLRRIQQLGFLQTNISRESGHFFIDSINNLKSVRCYSSEKFTLENYKQQVFSYVDCLYKIEFYQSMLKTIPVVLLLSGVAGYLFFFRSGSEKLDVAFIVSAIAYLSRFFPSLGQSLSALMKLISDSKSGQDVLRYAQFTQEPMAKEESFEKDEVVRDIVFEGVTFSFKDKSILNDFSYRFESGTVYSIVGESGAGKSTILDLLLKFYPARKGIIKVNGRDILTMRDKDLRSRVLLVEQRVTIFNDTIFRNITLGADYTLDQVQLACRMARIHDFIDGLDQGYQTKIFYMGSNLSGGQKQRIALARAILRNPEVLILDESLTALDRENKEQIFSDFKRYFHDKIFINVTHDPWIVEHSDVVLDLKRK